MKGNPTAGILLLLLASLLISIGLTNKGKQIINILLNRGESTTGTTDGQTTEPQKPSQSGGYSSEFPAPSVAKYPGTFVGEKGAKPAI